eukprot:9019001-Alexandrium_andersonii.AAC.1
MSASLVGSEMCIRDRRPADRPGRRRGRSELPRDLPSDLGLDGLGSLQPVSYTHLTLPTICSV